MRTEFHVYHEAVPVYGWPLTEAQIEHEYSTFPSMLAHYFDASGIQAECKAWEPQDEGVIVFVWGNKSEEELADAFGAFLVKLNTIKVIDRAYHPNFVVIKMRTA